MGLADIPGNVWKVVSGIFREIFKPHLLTENERKSEAEEKKRFNAKEGFGWETNR